MTKRSVELGGLTLADGRYTITATLGEGGMGSVYRAFDRNIESDVVIKVPRPAMMEDPEFAARFTREIRSLVKLSHPHIVKVSDVGMHENSPFAVMQFLPAGSLEDRLPRDSRGKPIPGDPKQVPGWLDAIAKALDYIHGRGYIHRDVKPGNILFDAEGHAFLSDFGVAKVLATSVDKEGTQAARTGTGMVLGTPEYMAPELIMGEPVDGRVDQYALAVTVYEFLCGRRPFENETKTKVLVLHTSKAPPLLTEWQPALPDRLVQAVMKGLAKDPNDRYPNCAGLAAAVAAAAAGAIAPAVEERVRFKCPQCGKKGAMPAGEYARLRQRGGRPSCPGCKVPLDEVSASAEYSPRTGSTSVFREVAGAEGGYALAPEPEVVRGGTFVMAAPKSHGEKPTDPEPRPSPGLKPALDAVYREAKAKASTELYPSAKAFAATVMDFVRSTVATARAATARPPQRPGNRPSPPPARSRSKDHLKSLDDLPPSGQASGGGQPHEPRFRSSHLVATGVAVALVASAIGLWAAGVFRVRTADGTLVVQVNEPNPEVYVDGEKVTVAWQNGGVKAEIGVKPGTRQVELKKDGFRVFGQEVTLEDHGRTVLVARLEPKAPETPGQVATAVDAPPDRPGEKHEAAAGQKAKHREWTQKPHTPAELAHIQEADRARGQSEHASTDPAEIAEIVGEVAPGFTAKTPVIPAGVAIVAEHFGRLHVLSTHPLNGSQPCILTSTIDVPAGKQTLLTLDVSHSAAGDWELIVLANGARIYDETVGPTTSRNGWLAVSVDLTRFAGTQVVLELQNKATGYSHEWGYWDKVKITSREVEGPQEPVRPSEELVFRRKKPGVHVVVPTSEEEGLTWRYTFSKPAANWFEVGYNASRWKGGIGGFGGGNPPPVRTNWETSDIWIRREFSLSQDKLTDPQLRLLHDEDAQIYLNGVLAAVLTGHTVKYELRGISPKSRATLKPGKNVIAVHCHQTVGWQYIDVGLVDVVPAE